MESGRTAEVCGGGILMGLSNPHRNGIMMIQQQQHSSNSTPSSSPSSSHSSMDMVTNNNPLPSPYYFMDSNNFISTSISASLPPADPHETQTLTLPNNTNLLPLPPTTNTSSSTSSGVSMRAKIMSHPHFPRLLSAFSNCQKVGAPAEVVARLEEVCGGGSTSAAAAMMSGARTSSLGEDPALDQFMEAYCEMLTKYEQELSKPFKEALIFLSRIESQFRALTTTNPSSSPNYNSAQGSGDMANCRNGSLEEDFEAMEATYIDPQAEDKELKVQLLRRYSGYLGNLKQEFLKKKKKGKLPKEARQMLLEWWNRHYKWPYPSETQKVALAEATGLDQKQINNWFINQRKRHWKPTEDMQFVVMDAANYPHYYLENGGNSFPLDFNSSSSHHHNHHHQHL